MTLIDYFRPRLQHHCDVRYLINQKLFRWFNYSDCSFYHRFNKHDQSSMPELPKFVSDNDLHLSPRWSSCLILANQSLFQFVCLLFIDLSLKIKIKRTHRQICLSAMRKAERKRERQTARQMLDILSCGAIYGTMTWENVLPFWFCVVV